MSAKKSGVTGGAIPQDEEDMELKDPITKEKMTVEGEHYSLNRDLVNRKKEPLKDGEGKVLSDRELSELVRAYSDFPETYNDLKKSGEPKVWEDKTGLTCELQEYRGEKEDQYQEIRRSYNTKKYGDIIKRLREAKKTGKI